MTKHWTLFFAFLIPLFIFSCNSSSEDSFSKNSETEAKESEIAHLDTIPILLKSNDKMQFDKKEIVVYHGQTVALTLEHVGTMPKSAMGHNFVLLSSLTSISEYVKKAEEKNDYIIDDPSFTLAHTQMIGGGESATIYFSAPEVGIYDFICSFPGHYAIMKGKFIVQ